MTLRILLLFLSISILSACGGGGGDPEVPDGDGDGDIVNIDGDGDQDIDEQNPNVELIIVKDRNWVAVEGSSLELIPYGRNISTEEEMRELKKGTLFWTITSGSEYASIEQVQRRANVTALIPCPDDNPYCVEVELKLDSSTGEIYTENVKLLVKQSADNLPPVADAGTDQTVSGGDTVSLDGSASLDLDGRVTNYAWSVVSGAVSEEDITGINTATPSFVAPESKYDQVIELKLVVTDDQGLVNDTGSNVKITVLKTLENIPPELDSRQNMEGRSGDRLSLTDPLFIDADGTLVKFTWTQNLEDYPDQPVVSDWENADKTGSAVTSFTLPVVEEETTLYFIYTVTDNDGDSASTDVEVTVIPLPEGNEIPVAKAAVTLIPDIGISTINLNSNTNPADEITVNENTQVCFDAGGENGSYDPDNNSGGLIYEWSLLGIAAADKVGSLPSAEQGCVDIHNTFSEYTTFIIQLTVKETADNASFSIPVKLTVNVKPVPKIESISFGGHDATTDLPVTTRTTQIEFSDVMDCSSINSALSVTDTTSGESVSGSVSCSDRTVSFTANAAELAYGHEYQAKLLTSAANSDGNDLATEHGDDPLVWNFNTAPSPTVTMATDNGELESVPVNTSLKFTFSENMDCSTINMTNLIVTRDVPGSDDDEVVYGSFTCPHDDDNKQVRFSPNTYLEHSSKYLVELTHSIKTSGHNPIESGNSFTFTTAEAPQVEIIISGEGDVYVDGDTELEQTGEPIVLPVDYEDALMLTLVPETGYHLEISGCGGTEDSVEDTYATGQVKDDCQILVNFEIDTFSISYDVDGYGGDIVLESSVAEYDSSVSFNVIPESGYTLNTNTLQSNCSLYPGEVANQYLLKNIKDNCTIEVSYEIKPTTLYVSAVKNGVIIDFNQFENSNLKHSVCYYMMPYNNEVTLENCYNESNDLHTYHTVQTGSYIDGLINGETYRFAYITYDAREDEGFMSGVMQAPVEVYLPKYYTITGHIRGEEGGTIETSDGVIVDSDGVELEEGTSHTFTIIPTPGSSFTVSGITGCNGSVVDNTSITNIEYVIDEISENCKLKASFWTTNEQLKGMRGQPFKDIIYANNLWVAVGNSGQISISTDRIHWQSKQAGNEHFSAVYFHQNRWVAVGGQGYSVIYYSDDGSNWIKANFPDDEIWYTDIYANNGFWVAVGYHGLATSTDGINWETDLEESPFLKDSYFTSVHSDENGCWVAVGEALTEEGTHIAYRKASDSSWNIATATGEMPRYYSVYSHENRWYAGGSGSSDAEKENALITSTDCSNWVADTNYNENTDSFTAVKANDSGDWVAASRNQRVLVKLHNEQSWTEYSISMLANTSSLTYYDDKWFVVSDLGVIASWQTGDDQWSRTSLFDNDYTFSSVWQDNGEWVAVGFISDSGWQYTPNSRAVIVTSDDIPNTDTADTIFDAGIPLNYISVDSRAGTTVAAGAAGQMVTYDGIIDFGSSPIIQEVDINSEIRGLSANDNTWVAIGNQVSTSLNGIEWYVEPEIPNQNFGYDHLAHVQNTWVAAGSGSSSDYDIFAYSGNGLEWQIIDAPPARQITKIFGNEESQRFVAIGNNRNYGDGFVQYLLQSKDGINWDYVVLPELSYGDFYEVHAYQGEWLLIGGYHGISFTDDQLDDLSTLPLEPFPISAPRSCNTYTHNNQWILAGENGWVIKSQNLSEWTVQDLGSDDINQLAAHNGQWVLVGDNGFIASSLDSENWIIRQLAINNYVDITYNEANNQWVAVGHNGQIFTAFQPQDE